MIIDGNSLCGNCFMPIESDKTPCPFCNYKEGQNNTVTSNLPIGTILLGKYCIGKVLGKGGFGITYLAYDLKNSKKVAIKEYMPDSLAYRNPGTTLISTYLGEKEDNFKVGAEKFYDEAKTIARFNGHPNIINVLEFFYENNTAYFVMEYIDGIDLKKYVLQKGGTLSLDEVYRIIQPIMDALIVIHSVGVLHRDISPDNIYITKDNEVKLLDFGAARQVLGEQSKSLSVVLKPGFAPIEQYQTKGKQGPWTDVYALAATMYYCLTGRVLESAMDRVLEDNLKISETETKIPKQFINILLKALSLNGVNRYQTIAELKNDIEKLNIQKKPEYKTAEIINNDEIKEEYRKFNTNKHTENKKSLLYGISLLKNKKIIITASVGVFLIFFSLVVSGILNSLNDKQITNGDNGGFINHTSKDLSQTSNSSQNASSSKQSDNQNAVSSTHNNSQVVSATYQNSSSVNQTSRISGDATSRYSSTSSRSSISNTSKQSSTSISKKSSSTNTSKTSTSPPSTQAIKRKMIIGGNIPSSAHAGDTVTFTISFENCIDPTAKVLFFCESATITGLAKITAGKGFNNITMDCKNTITIKLVVSSDEQQSGIFIYGYDGGYTVDYKEFYIQII